MTMCGRSKIPGLSQLSQLFQYLYADPDPALLTVQGGVPVLLENDLRPRTLETQVGSVLHWAAGDRSDPFAPWQSPASCETSHEQTRNRHIIEVGS